ncbi:MAG: PAS domain S-box protein [Sedimentisphaerales bacterium]|jgi:PAS domain S-box-containing protein
MLDTVAVPEQFEPIFRKAQEYVSAYFSQKKEDASTGTIEIFGQRYILVRAASMSVDFFDTIKGMFKDCGEENASEMARSLLFDVAHTIGKMDARNFHQRMGLRDPIEKLSVGPIHFSYTGWAFVDIFAESKPTADENFYLIYDHPFSFEADAWEKSGKKNSSCVCTMSAGYSSGWCEESFGIPLVASEIMCKARGDSACRFIMAHPSRMAQYLQAYLRSHPEISDNAMLYKTGGFFQGFRQVQEALQKSEERFKQVAENAGDWIWEVNAEGLYTYSSPVVEKILGYEPEELVGKKYFYDLFAPDVKEELKKVTFEAFAKRESIKNFVNPKVHKNGRIVILEANNTPVVDDKGNLCGYRGACRDITERKQTEERLLAVNALQKLLLPPVPIEQKLKFITDAVVRILDADFARIWVIKPGDRCEAGCTHAQVTEGPHVCRFRDKCLHLMASSGRYTHLDGKVHRRVPFGCYKIGLIAAGKQDKFLTNEAATDPRVHNHDWVKELGLVSFAGYRLTHTEGTPLGVLALFSKHPISPEEDALLEGIAHSTSQVLHTSLAEEAVENLNKNLKSTIQELSRSNRQLQDFVHVAAHDLKTPVRGIGTLADWIVGDYGDKLDEGGRENIRLLKARVIRIDNLIDGMLQFSKIARNRQNEQETDLNSLVSEVIERIKPGNSIEIAVDSLPKVTCERGHMVQVFENLLANAVAFMDKPKGLIKVGCVEQGDFWRFYIRDNGPGIEKKHWERIFKIFQTLPTKDEPDTAGIGLTITRKIVEIYGGKIWVESQLGEGSTFFFTFPGQREKAIYANTKADTAC